MNLMRLIDADELIKRHCKDCNADVQESCKTDAICSLLIWLAEEPTIDAEPVVRCEDCIWHRERNKKEQAYLIEGVLICTNVEATDGGWLPVFPTHFCSYGERKDGE